jgi:prepilin-type N-terminal cleavage/methylation domain-containing protein
MKKSCRTAGFTLIELLIVMGMFGIVITAMYSLYLTHQRSAYTQDEVVEVQQNLRIAMDSITRDIRNAGTLIPRTDSPATSSNVDNSPVGNAGPNSITLNMASSQEGYAWITTDLYLTGPTTDFTVTVDSTASLGNFTSGDFVRIMRPELMTEATGTAGSLYSVTGTATMPSPTMNLHYISGWGIQPDISTPFKRGDVIARVTSATPGYVHPNSVVYSLGTGGNCPAGQTCVMRSENGAAGTVIATNIASASASPPGLQFSYIMDDMPTNEVSQIPALPNYPNQSDASKIKEVRVTVTGQTVTTVPLSGGQAKQRQMTSIIKLRNR